MRLSFLLLPFFVGLMPGQGEVLLEDQFDHYRQPEAPFQGRWSEELSGSGDVWNAGLAAAPTWQSQGAPANAEDGPASTRRIVPAPGDRPGQVFAYTEAGPRAHYPTITTAVPPFPPDTQAWQLEVDFYLDTLAAPLAQGGFGLLALRSEPFEVDGKPGYTVVTRVVFGLVDGEPCLALTGGDTPGGKEHRIEVPITPQRWYRLAIHGNHGERHLRFFLDGEPVGEAAYLTPQASLASVSLGDVNPYGNTFHDDGSTAMLDRFRLRAIPERPAAAVNPTPHP